MSSRPRPPLLLLLLLPLLLLFSAGKSTDPSSPQCTSLLDLKRSFSPSSVLATWQPGTDCCSWHGVTCRSGLVTDLNLSNSSIAGNISTALFKLTSLRSLNLAYNTFDEIPIPNELGLLANLTSLNLSNAGFVGQIPIGIANLTNLVSLDLSSSNLNEVGTLQLVDPSFEALIGNFSDLRELYLDGITISADGYQWGAALAKSTPKLQVLSLTGCSISGPIDSSLVKLRNLSVIRLDQIEVNSSLPDFFVNFLSLSVLRLSYCGLGGNFPKNVFLLKNLTDVDLSGNQMLSGSLPDFSDESKLQRLVLSHTSFSGSLPNSIGKLKSLTKMDLSSCKFGGKIPSSIGNLTQLVHLDLSMNNFGGTIPSVLSPKLSELILEQNMLTGLIPSSIGMLKNLVKLDLSNNSLSGQIPVSLFTLPSLQVLKLNMNKLSGNLQDFPGGPSQLSTVDLSNNNLQGEFPRSVFWLPGIKVLTLASNNFSGVVELNWIGNLRTLSSLDLSYNRISMRDENVSHSVSFPNITKLALVSCNLTSVPSFLRFQNQMSSLDLSNNNIVGAIPNWIWSTGAYTLNYLNLSCNSFTSLEGPLPNFNVNWSINNLDLHSNMIRGPIPLPPTNTVILDYSNNSFSSTLPSNISSYLSFTVYFSLANNKITGELPPSICNASFLQVLDCSDNLFNGSIPPCIFEESTSLVVLNLRGNQFQGTIPRNIGDGCRLRTITLNGNQLEGRLPRSLTNCRELEVLDLGNNHITGSFPFWLGNIHTLLVMILRSNKFYGLVSPPPGTCSTGNLFPVLQIFDISSNYFNGTLPVDCFKHLKGMMLPKLNSTTVEFEYLHLTPHYYQNMVTVTIKGLDMALSRVLRIFTSLDLSNNKFEGNVPDVGELVSLLVLNLSHNALTGSIPSSMGNLVQLESLDLSENRLSGEIPPTLSNLTFLAFLNLSNNNLVGSIPQDRQLSTFSNTSFEGNKGLCGSPLTKQCNHSSEPELQAFVTTNDVNWQFVFIGIGFGAGLAMVVGVIMMWETGRNWYDKKVDGMLMAIVPMALSHFCNYFGDRRVAAEERMANVCKDIDGLDARKFCVFCTKLEFDRQKVRIHHVDCDCVLGVQ